MNIELIKFGTTLTSRQSGKEALAAIQSAFEAVPEKEDIIVDFTGVVTFSPSWGDEFITPLYERYGERLVLKNTANPSVKATLRLLEGIIKTQFKRID